MLSSGRAGSVMGCMTPNQRSRRRCTFARKESLGRAVGSAMCGIIGQVRFDGERVEPELPARMCSALEHRGPDSRGIHLDDGVALGIQRLRVVDLSTGDQPIYNED